MNNKPETQATIADVVAKMRRFADRHWMHPACQVMREFADMLDSALKRDREVVVSKKELPTFGNAAKLRETLVCIGHIAEYLEAGTVNDLNHAYRNIQDRVEIALAAPPRECDVGTAEEQAERFQKFCLSRTQPWHGCDGTCPVLMSEKCALNWAQMPYEESEAAK